MRYLYNPVTGALDDVETPKLGEKYFASAETDEIIKNINDEFGPGTLFPASEAPQPEIKTPQAVFEFGQRNPAAHGGNIGGGIIGGTDTGDGRTGFANIFLDEGKKSRFAKSVDTIVIDGKEFRQVTKLNDPNFGKYVYRTSKSGKETYEYLTEPQLKKRVANPQIGKSPFVPSKGYLAELEDIKAFVKNKGDVNKIYLSDLVAEFGDVTKVPEGEIPRDTNTERKIKTALGDKEYNKLIKGGDPLKIKKEKKIKFNKLVRDVNRGDRPLIDLSSEKTGIQSDNFTRELGPVEKKMYKNMSPKLKAITARLGQPAQNVDKNIYIKDLKNTTIKNYNAIIKKYPSSAARRTLIFKGGFRSYNAQSYILSQIGRHTEAGGNLYSHVGGDTMSTGKFRNLKTNKLITLNNMDLTSPEFKHAAKVYNDWKTLTEVEIDNPLDGEKIKIGKGIRIGSNKSDGLVIDHTKSVKTAPLKGLIITSQKQNQGFELVGLTEDEKKRFYRKDLTLKDNIKRFTKYTKRLLESKAKGINAYVTPTKTIEKYRSRIINGLNSGIPLDTIFGTLADDLDLPIAQIKNVAGKTLRGLGKVAMVADPVFMAFDEKRATDRGAGSLDTAEYMVDSFVQGILNLPKALEDVAYLATDEGTLQNFGEKQDRLFDYENFIFAEKKLEKNLKETPMKERVNNLMLDFASAGGYKDSKLADPEYLKIFESLSDEDLEKMLKEKDEQNKELLEDNKEDPTIMGIDMDNSVSEALSKKYANGGRINYEDGSPRGPNEPEGDDFLNELEFNFNNIDDVTIDDEPITFDDSKSKIQQFNDLLDIRNIPYIGDMAAQAALRIGEFGARIIPATGELVSDLIRKPLFKGPGAESDTYDPEGTSVMLNGEEQFLDVKQKASSYEKDPITDYTDRTGKDAKFVGGAIFRNFLENITPTTTEKLVGLDTLINEEKKKMIKRGDSSLMVKVGETASLGAELVAPIFPGLKILRAYASAKGLKPTKEVAKTMEQEIDQMAAAKGMTRREFLTATGAVGTIALAKMLGIAGELPKIAKVTEAVTSVAKNADGVPEYLYNLKNVIRMRGELQPSSSAFLDGQEVFEYKGITLYHNTYPKDGSFRIAKEFETNATQSSGGEPSYNKVEMEVNKGELVVKDEGLETQSVVHAADEFEEATAYPTREGGEDVDFYVDDEWHKQLEEISKELEEIDHNIEVFGWDK